MKTAPTLNSRRLGLRFASFARALPAVLALAALTQPAK
jgi:hypothetical protein